MSALMNINGAFTDRLQQALRMRGYSVDGDRGTLTKLSKAMGISHVGFRKWLHGEALPTQEHLIKISLFLEVNPIWLLSGQGRIEVFDIQDEEIRLLNNYRNSPPNGKMMIQTVSETASRYT